MECGRQEEGWTLMGEGQGKKREVTGGNPGRSQRSQPEGCLELRVRQWEQRHWVEREGVVSRGSRAVAGLWP